MPIEGFLLKKTNMFTEDGSKQALFLFTICPAKLNTRSEGTLVAGMHRYLRASCIRTGYLLAFTFHHCNKKIEKAKTCV